MGAGELDVGAFFVDGVVIVRGGRGEGGDGG